MPPKGDKKDLNVFAAVFAHYLLSFDVRNKVLNRSHESHNCPLSTQAQLCEGRKPCCCRNEVNTPRLNILQCMAASGRVTMNGSVQKN